MSKKKLNVDIDKDELLNKGKGVFSDFKDFISQGDVLDLAVGVIMGGAFGKIVTSIVNDLIMPPIGVIIGGVDFKDLKWVMKEAIPEQLDEAGNVVQKAVAEVTLNYGAFIQNVIDFLIIAFCVFMLVKFITKLTTKKKAEEPAAPPGSISPRLRYHSEGTVPNSGPDGSPLARKG